MTKRHTTDPDEAEQIAEWEAIAPKAREVAEALAELAHTKPPGKTSVYRNESRICVRLQVLGDGTWALHTGGPQYDPDHRGYWGATTIEPGNEIDSLMKDAKYLISEAADYYRCT